MKKLISFIVFVGLAAIGQGQGPVLVYSSSGAVKDGKPWFGTPTKDGILITAEQALESHVKPLIGTSDGLLFESILIRLDNEINTAIFRLGEMIKDESLGSAHQNNVARVEKAMKVESSEEVKHRYQNAADESAATAAAAESKEFEIRINGKPLREAPFRLVKKYKKSNFDLTVVNNKDTPVWRFDIRMEADPPLSFMKEGKKKGLNDIPRRTFIYQYQVLFKPLKEGREFTVPIDVHFIKETAYQLKIEVKTKEEMVLRTVPVQFYEEEK